MAKADPQDKENRLYFSNKLRELLNLNNKKQVDLHRDLGIPKSTITGYIKGTSLPNPETSQKIANYFGVKRSELDRRYSDSPKGMTVEEALSTIMSFDDQPVTDHDRKVMANILKSYLQSRDDKE